MLLIYRITFSGEQIMMIQMPKTAEYIIDKLYERGFECYAVGGCIRDSLSGRYPHDWDFTTNAAPDEIISCFSEHRVIDIGKKYGTICVVINNENFEITTYRTDGSYADSRHPDSVAFSRDLVDDLSRRDFTINALAYNHICGLVDEFNGVDDLKNGIIRCINDPDNRFSEDALRILRALRFASTCGYMIEPLSEQAIFRNMNSLLSVSKERISSELTRILCGKNVEYILNRYRDVFAVIIPELVPMFGFDQHTPHHNLDVYAHTARAVSYTYSDPILRTAMLLHDTAKPISCKKDENGRCHFKGHPDLSAEIAESVLRRLRFKKSSINTICLLIRYHDNRLTPDSKTVKRCMRDIGAQNVASLLNIQYADIMAQSDYLHQQKLDTLSAVKKEYERVLSSGECYSLPDLAIRGNDIKHLGVSDDKYVGMILEKLLDAVICDQVPNSRQQLASYAAELITEL